jgi:hypothetical protein
MSAVHVYTPPTPVSLGKIGTLRTPLQTAEYAAAEHAAGQAQVRRLIAERKPRLALLMLARTVEAQARIHNIGGVRLPVRPSAVTR